MTRSRQPIAGSHEDSFVLVRVTMIRFLAAEAICAGFCVIGYFLVTTSHGPSVYTSPPAKVLSAFLVAFLVFWMIYAAVWMVVTRGIQLLGTRHSLVRTVTLPTRDSPFRIGIEGDLRDLEFRMKPLQGDDRFLVLTFEGSAGRLEFPLSRFIVPDDIYDRVRAWQASMG